MEMTERRKKPLERTSVGLAGLFQQERWRSRSGYLDNLGMKGYRGSRKEVRAP